MEPTLWRKENRFAQIYEGRLCLIKADCKDIVIGILEFFL